jgi:hypothetical protein
MHDGTSATHWGQSVEQGGVLRKPRRTPGVVLRRTIEKLLQESIRPRFLLVSWAHVILDFVIRNPRHRSARRSGTADRGASIRSRIRPKTHHIQVERDRRAIVEQSELSRSKRKSYWNYTHDIYP